MNEYDELRAAMEGKNGSLEAAAGLYSLFEALVKQGFTEEQAMKLICTMLLIGFRGE